MIVWTCLWLFVPLVILQELQLLYDRKVDLIIQDNIKNFGQISAWISTFSMENGTWQDVDYTTGCPARRANWPAQQHFLRTLTLASQYRSNHDTQLLPIISKAMDYWFGHNYEPDTCLDEGGLANSTCPCDTPGFWNTNWFGQMILMPRFITSTCLLLKANLTTTQKSNCTLTSQRVYDRIDSYVIGIGPMTGANMLDAATSVLNLGLLTDNETTVQIALDHYYGQTTITTKTGEDGVKADGSYLQHAAQLYNGNYGKEFINSVVMVYYQTSNTSFGPPLASQEALLTLLNGTEWMIVSNSTNSSLLWEYSAIGRMVSFASVDGQASGGVALNLTRIQQATSTWTHASDINRILNRLWALQTQSSPSQGQLQGTRIFYHSDYVVHRNTHYATTLKMFSTRTSNSECNNDQNPFGFHLSDGVIYIYRAGDEYLDCFAAWDWNLVPGTTVDYGATPLGCNSTQFYGNTSFVGGLSTTGHGGMAVMQYINPMTGALRWEKTFYFFDGFYAVQVGSLQCTSNNASVITTLDQSNLKGDVYINGQLLTTDTFVSKKPTWDVWHNRILYSLVNQTGLALHVNTASHAVNNWTSIGISKGVASQRIFTATIEHALLNDATYVVQIDTDAKESHQLDSLVQFVNQDSPLGRVRGAYHVRDNALALAFWTPGSFQSPWDAWTIQSNQPILVWYCESQLTVADPTQLLSSVMITLNNLTFDIRLPQGEFAGSSVSMTV